MAKTPSPDTITQAYAKPLNHNGQRIEAGEPLELPSARAKVMEARLGLHEPDTGGGSGEEPERLNGGAKNAEGSGDASAARDGGAKKANVLGKQSSTAAAD